MASSHTLRFGSMGKEVGDLQSMLSVVYVHGKPLLAFDEIDGNFGLKTQAAVKELQQLLIDQKLLKIADPTGVYGPLTRDAVRRSHYSVYLSGVPEIANASIDAPKTETVAKAAETVVPTPTPKLEAVASATTKTGVDTKPVPTPKPVASSTLPKGQAVQEITLADGRHQTLEPIPAHPRVAIAATSVKLANTTITDLPLTPSLALKDAVSQAHAEGVKPLAVAAVPPAPPPTPVPAPAPVKLAVSAIPPTAVPPVQTTDEPDIEGDVTGPEPWQTPEIKVGPVTIPSLTLFDNTSAFDNQQRYLQDRQHVSHKRIAPLLENGEISSGYGMRRHPITGVVKMHAGDDVRASSLDDKRVVAPIGGFIDVDRNPLGAEGVMVVIYGDDGHKYQCLHLAKGSIPAHWKDGARVEMGELIGEVGGTGSIWSARKFRLVSSVTAPHLHFDTMAPNHNPPHDSHDFHHIDPAALYHEYLRAGGVMKASIHQPLDHGATVMLAREETPSAAPAPIPYQHYNQVNGYQAPEVPTHPDQKTVDTQLTKVVYSPNDVTPATSLSSPLPTSAGGAQQIAKMTPETQSLR